MVNILSSFPFVFTTPFRIHNTLTRCWGDWAVVFSRGGNSYWYSHPGNIDLYILSLCCFYNWLSSQLVIYAVFTTSLLPAYCNDNCADWYKIGVVYWLPKRINLDKEIGTTAVFKGIPRQVFNNQGIRSKTISADTVLFGQLKNKMHLLASTTNAPYIYRDTKYLN